VLLTTFIGGTRAPDLAHLSDADLHKVVLADLERLFHVTGEPSFVHRRTWPQAIPQYKPGHGRFIASIRDREARYPGLHVGGNARDGISLSYCIEGGRRLAEEADVFLKRLSKY
jgi:oxygen-dependent protoporphyrinogen oxidase